MKIEEKFIRREIRFKLLVVIAILLVSAIIILAVPNMLVSFVLAFVITYSLNPTVNSLERAGLDRTMAIIIPFSVIGVILVLGGYLLSPILADQMADVKAKLPAYMDGVTEILNQFNHSLSSIAGPLMKESVTTKAVEFIQQHAQSFVQSLPALAGQIFTVMVLAPFFSFFMLRDGRKVMRSILTLVPNNFFELVLNLTHQISEQLGGFIRARALESLIVGGVVWAGLLIMGFPYSVFLGIIAGITNLIPYIGPIIGAVPAFVVAIVNKDASLTLILLGVVYGVSQLIDMLFIIPLVVAKIVNLHPVTVVLAIIIGGQVMGILGMIISIPIASILKLTSNAVYNHIIGFRI